jgi:hypothetical protein
MPGALEMRKPFRGFMLKFMSRSCFWLLLALFFLTGAVLVAPNQHKVSGRLSQALLTTSECITPCLFNIRPGFTGLEAAAQSLLSRPDVVGFEQLPVGSETTKTFRATIALDDEQYQLYLETQRGIIESITLHGTGNQMGNIFLSLGSPALLFMENIQRQNVTRHVGFYPAVQVVTQIDFPTCVFSQTSLWTSRWETRIMMMSATKYIEQESYFSDTPGFNAGWRPVLSKLTLEHCI